MKKQSTLKRALALGMSAAMVGATLAGWAERASAMLDLTPMMVGPHTTALRVAPPAHEPGLPAALHGVRA